jgi:hypothetical protein
MERLRGARDLMVSQESGAATLAHLSGFWAMGQFEVMCGGVP